jgi:hypothetical protein
LGKCPALRVAEGNTADAKINPMDILSRMDDSKITKQHWKIMFISGMGFFTDAYDLFIIGVVIALLKDEWHPSPWAVVDAKAL